MKIIINIIVLFVLSIQSGFAQPQLDNDKIKRNWKTIVTELTNRLNVAKSKTDTAKLFPKNNNRFELLYNYYKSVKFNGKDFESLKITDYDKYNLRGMEDDYTRIVENYITEMNKKYKKESDKDKPKTKHSESDSIKILNAKVDSLNKVVSQLKTDTIRLSNQIIKLQTKISKQQPVTAENEKSFLSNWPWFLVIVLLLALIYFILKKWYHTTIENEDLHEAIKTLKMQKQSSDTKLRSLQNQKPKEIIKEKEVVKTVYVEVPKEGKKEEVKYQYLCQLNSANGGYFKRVLNSYDSSSFYRMLNSDGTKAQYEFNGDMERAIKNWSSILDPASDYDGDTDTAHRIETIEQGVIQYDSVSECWKIIKKAKLKLY